MAKVRNPLPIARLLAPLTRFRTTAFAGPWRSSQTLSSSPGHSPVNPSFRSFNVALKAKVFFVTLPSDSGVLWPLRVSVPVRYL